MEGRFRQNRGIGRGCGPFRLSLEAEGGGELAAVLLGVSVEVVEGPGGDGVQSEAALGHDADAGGSASSFQRPSKVNPPGFPSITTTVDTIG